MTYNKEYTDIQYFMIQIFMIKAGSNILDVSYEYEHKKIVIQIVLLRDTVLSEKIEDKLLEYFEKFEIVYVYMTKDEFNSNKGAWQPLNYRWLRYLLFSKAEIL